MKYVYCSSTYPIFIGLYLKSKGYEISFLYSRKKYDKLFELIGTQALYIENPSYKELLLRPNKVKYRLREINKIIGSNDLVFTHTQFSTFLFIILFNRLKNAKNLLYRIEPTTNNHYGIFSIIRSLKNYLQSYLLKLALQIHYGAKTKLSFYSMLFFLSLNEKNNTVIEKKLSKSFEIIQLESINNLQINSSSHDILFIGQNESIMKDIVYSRQSIESLYNYIEKMNISVKPHPSGYPYPHANNLVSPDIPTEFLFNNINKAIISISSTTLISASHYYKNQNIKPIKIICLMNLVDYLDIESENEMRQRIKSRALDNIYYPENYMELSNLLFNT